MDCSLCSESVDNGQPTVVLTEKGCRSINKLSETGGRSKVRVQVGQTIHKKCRLNYIRQRVNKNRNDFESTASVNRRSQTPRFVWREHCLFCGQPAKYNGRKRGFDVFPVRTKDFKNLINEQCLERNDEWAGIVQGRLQYAQDLHAADAVYHQTCNVNFRTGKQIPKKYSGAGNEPDFKRQKGRPTDSAKTAAFLKVATFLEENDEEQLTIVHLTCKMKEYLEHTEEQPYSEVYMKKKLQEHFGDKIVITNINNQNVVTFQRTVSSIINEFYKQPKAEDYELEKTRIVLTAAKLIKSEIKNLVAESNDYPSCEVMASEEQACEFLPNLLQVLLGNIFVGKEIKLKVASIGQSIVQAARPRALIAPLQLGLAIQLHHHFASKFLIDSLHSHGFCSSYAVVQKYERSAAVHQGTEIPGYTPEKFVQFVADNVDHNTRSLDGNGTFHGMGIIATITPGVKSKQTIPMQSVTADEITLAGRIDIHAYKGPIEDNVQLLYKPLNDLQVRDATTNLDFLWKLTLPLLRSPRPGWAGTMQGVCHSLYPGKSSVMFLPMIDLDPTDMTCIYSTLSFISKQATRYEITPILTFDQPLWWKALTIQLNEPHNSDIKSIVLRLGGFHIQMSFLGCIGHLMAGSGLEEILELGYAKNAVIHMLSGKAISRAIRGHFLVDRALNAILVCKTFNVPNLARSNDIQRTEEGGATETVAGTHDLHTEEGGATETVAVTHDLHTEEGGATETVAGTHDLHTEEGGATETDVGTVEGLESLHANSTNVTTDRDVEKAKHLLKQLEEGECSVEEVCSSDILNTLSERFEQMKRSLKSQRTAVLWMEYMRMVDILRTFIKAERTGNWNLHLKAVYEMLPYFASAGHNLYAKSSHIYLQMMNDLEDKHPDVYRHFQDGFHCARRSDRYWAGLPTDLMIEQVLMRSVKTSGGLTRGKGFSETQRLIWLLSMPACAEVNDAMQTLTRVRYHTSEQHKDTTESRKLRDHKDTLDIVDYLSQRDPFAEDQSLRSIATGVVAGENVDVDNCKEVGVKVMSSMVGKNAYEYSFCKKNKAVTLASKTAVKLMDGEIQVDPQLLFQRLSFVATGGQYNDPQLFFKYEMCSYPPALFDSSLLPRQANKPVLADAMWTRTKSDEQTALPTCNVRYVLDGGALIHRIPWPRGVAYNDILLMCTQYVNRRYGQAIVVFDGYEEGPSTKDCAHQRRSGVSGPPVNFDCDMVLTLKKEEFLSNAANKQRFIHFLGEKLQLSGCTIVNSTGDADLMIVQAAIQSARTITTVLVGDDTDLLVLLCHYAEMNTHELFFAPQPKQRSTRRRIWNIKKTVSALGPEICNNILFVHAVLGCDTTSRLFGIGKGMALKKISTDAAFREQAQIFDGQAAPKDAIIAAGEKALICLYGGRVNDSLDSLRYSRFCQKISTGTSFVEPECLPPTSAAAAYHSLRVYLQVQEWKGVKLQPEEWGWRIESGKLIPLRTDLPAAHLSLLEMIRCNCKADCHTKRCSCRKHGLECTSACGTCGGQSCTNSIQPELSENDESA